MSKNENFLTRRAASAKRDLRLKPTAKNLATNVSRLIEDRDRVDSKFTEFVQANNLDRTDANGSVHIPLDEATIKELRADAAASSVTDGGARILTNDLGDLDGIVKLYSAMYTQANVARAGQHEKWVRKMSLNGDAKVHEVAAPTLDSGLSELEDGDLKSATIATRDFDLTRSLVGASWSGLRGAIQAGSFTAEVIDSLATAMDLEYDRYCFSIAAANGTPAGIGVDASLYRDKLIQLAYAQNFVNPIIIGSATTNALVAGGNPKDDSFGSVAGIPVITSDTAVADAATLVMVDGANSMALGTFDYELIVDKYTGAEQGLTKAMLSSQYAAQILDSTGVVSISLS